MFDSGSFISENVQGKAGGRQGICAKCRKLFFDIKAVANTLIYGYNLTYTGKIAGQYCKINFSGDDVSRLFILFGGNPAFPPERN